MDLQLPSEEIARQIAERFWHKPVQSVARYPTGLCHHVYAVTRIDGRQAVVRIARPGNESLLGGAVYWQDRLRPLGIPLARILDAGLDRSEFPFAYLVLEHLDGRDLGDIYPLLSDESKWSLGTQMAMLQQTVAALPAARGFGDALSYEEPKFAPTWNEVVQRNLLVCRARVSDRSPISHRDISALEHAAAAIGSSLARVAPTAFLDDTTTKNVIVSARGHLSGIVDVDTICFGDPLYPLGLTQAACAQMGYDQKYTDRWKQALELNEDDHGRLEFYTKLFAAVLLSEHGQRFNRDTCVNFERDAIARLQQLLTGDVGAARDRVS